MTWTTVKPTEDGRWVTTQESKWFVRLSKNRTLTITIPEGFHFDGNSAKLLPAFTHAHTFSASTVHDWLYYSHKDDYGPVSRAEADKAFRLIMEDKGAHFIRRWYMWTGVRVFSFFAWWNSHKRDNAFAKS